jgi:gluconolactonase
VIYKWSSGDPLSVFLEKSGYTSKDVRNVGDQTISGRLAILLIGSNELTLDSQDGTRTVLADRYEGKRFSGPNDLAIKSDGAIYFTDSVFGMRGGAESPARELPYNGFFLIVFSYQRTAR